LGSLDVRIARLIGHMGQCPVGRPVLAGWRRCSQPLCSPSAPASASPLPVAGRRSERRCCPGVIVAGTFHQDGKRVFWDVHNKDKAVVIELKDDTYQRLVIEVDDPRATVELIEGAVVPR